MPKPANAFTWATAANYSSGVASGNPTKVAPLGWPNVTEGFFPDTDIAAEVVQYVFNHVGLWCTWVFDGSPGGAADAHIVETDSNGDTRVQALALGGDTLTLDGDNSNDFVVERAQRSGTGANRGANVVLRAQQGQAQTGGAANNDGGDVVVHAARPGTGGSGNAGQVGRFVKHYGSDRSERGPAERERHLTYDNTGGGASTYKLDTLTLEELDAVEFQVTVMARTSTNLTQFWTGSAYAYNDGTGATIADAGTAWVSATGAAAFGITTPSAASYDVDLELTLPANCFADIFIREKRPAAA